MDTELITIDPAEANAKAGQSATSSYFNLRAYDRMSQEPRGWLGCTHGAAANYLRIYNEHEAASLVKFSEEGALKYLERATVPYDRYLGLSANSYAGWGLYGGQRNAIIFHPDGSISLDPHKDESFKNRYLYLSNSGLYTNYCCWSDNAENSNILIFKKE